MPARRHLLQVAAASALGTALPLRAARDVAARPGATPPDP